MGEKRTYIGEADHYLTIIEAGQNRIEALRDMPGYQDMRPEQRGALKRAVRFEAKELVARLQET